METMLDKITFVIMFIGLNIIGVYLCLSLRVPSEYRTNDKK